MRRTDVLILSLILSCAAPAARADEASRLKLARDVVEVAHAADNMRAVMPMMVAQMRQVLSHQGVSDPQRIEFFMKRFQQKFDDGIGEFVDLVAQVYAKEFTDDDLSNLLVFYRSPTGQHLVAKQAVMAQAMMLAGQRWGQSIAQQVVAEFEKEKAAAPPPKL